MDNTYEIYQVKSGEAFRNYRFESIESLDYFGLKVDYNNYDFVYRGNLEQMDLEDIFRKFNEDRPDDFRGRSLSVSDVVILNKDGEVSAHFVDSFGFKDVPEFLIQREQKKDKDFSVLKALKENKTKVEKSDKGSKEMKHEVDER